MELAYVVFVVNIYHILIFACCSKYSSKCLLEFAFGGQRYKHRVETRDIYACAKLAVCSKYNVLVWQVLYNI